MGNATSKSGSGNAAQATKAADNPKEATRPSKAAEMLETNYAISKNAAEYSESNALGGALSKHPFSGAAEKRAAQILSKFLLCVAQGKQDEAEKLLKISQKGKDTTSTWLLGTGDVMDYSGRKFTGITAYEYAYWAKDTHMCRMLEKYMGEATKAVMLARIDAIEQNGLTYKQPGVGVTSSKHFDLTQLITTLKQYVDGCTGWERADDWDTLKAAWMAVGLAQRDVPVHVINEYCRKDRSFRPLPEFKKDNLPRDLTFFNFYTGQDETLFPLVVSESSGLGVDFSLLAAGIGGRVGVQGGAGITDALSAEGDLKAVSHLDKVRTDDLTQSRENLKPIEPHEHPGMSH